MIRRRTPPRPGKLVGGAVWALLGALLFAAFGFGAGPTQAAPTPPEPVPPVEITLDRISPDFLDEDDELTLAGTLTNHGDAPLADVVVWWRMQTHVPTGEGLTQWLQDENDTNVVTLARHDVGAPLEPGESAGYRIVIPPADSPFDYGSTWGPRGIEMVVSATEEGGATQVRAQTRSTIIWYPEGASAPTGMTVGVPLAPTQSEWSRTLQEKASIAEVAAPRIEKILTALGGHEVAWGVDAALVDEVPAARLRPFLPSDDPAHAPPGGPDPGVSASPGGGSEAGSEVSSEAGAPGEQPTNGAPQTPPEQGEEDEDANSPPLQWEPSPAAGDLARAIREATGSREVISLGWAEPDLPGLLRTGIAGAQLYARNSARAGAVLDDAGIPAHPDVAWSTTHLGVEAIAKLGSETTVLLTPPTADGGEFTPDESPHLTVRSPQASLVDLLGHRNPPGEVLARTAIAAREAATSLLVTLPPTLTADQASELSENLSALGDAPWLEITARPSSAGSSPGAASPQKPASPERPASAQSDLTSSELTNLTQALSAADAFAQLTEDAPLISSLFETTALLAVSTVWNNEEAVRDHLLDTVEQAAHADYLTIEQTSDVNLISQGGNLPVSVSNTGPLTLHPRVVLEPGDARLRSEEPVTADLKPGQSTTVRVPITAVANGNVPATIRLLNNDGEEVAAAREFTVRVRADWETTGTAVLAGLVAAGFLFGIFRNIRRANTSAPHPRRHHG